MTERKIDERMTKLKGELKRRKVMTYLPNELYEAFKKKCERKDFSMNGVLIALVEEYMGRAEDAPKKGK